MQNILFSLLLSACLLFSVPVHALKIDVKSHSIVRPERSLWKPSDVQKLSETTFCFTAIDGKCNVEAPLSFEEAAADAAVCPETLLCSFDAGATFTEAEVTLPFCGNKGVVAEGQLFCPHESLPSMGDSDFAFSSVAFGITEAGEPKLTEAVTPEKQFVFKAGTDLVAGAEKAVLGCNILYDKALESYLTVVTLVDQAGQATPALFLSADGFTFTAAHRVPVRPSRQYRVATVGRNILVYARAAYSTASEAASGDEAATAAAAPQVEAIGYERVVSSTGGRRWSAARIVNTTYPVSTLLYPSGLKLHYGLTNLSNALRLSYSVPEAPTPTPAKGKGKDKKKDKKKEAKKDEGPTELDLLAALKEKGYKVPPGAAASSSGHVAVLPYDPHADSTEDNTTELMTVFDLADGKGGRALHRVTYHVDDTAEAKARAEEIEEARRQEEAAKAAREKVRKETLERERRQRRERLEKERRRREQFEAADAVHRTAAKEAAALDGEYIIVRRVQRDTIDLEKDTFFDAEL